MRTILFPVDVGHTVEHVVPSIAALAKQQDARVHLLHVLNEEDPEHYGDPMLFANWTEFEGHARKVTDRRLARILRMPALDGVDVECSVESGENAWEGVLAVAERIGADLIVLPSRIKAASGQRVLGSLASRLLGAESPPILLFSHGPEPAPDDDDDSDPTTPETRFRRILVPSDGSAAFEKVATHAAEIARAVGGGILVLHVVEDSATDPAADKALGDAFARRTADIFAGLPVEIHIAHGKPSKVIPVFADAHDIDVVFMACHGKNQGDDFVGENMEHVIRHITQPICVL